MYLVSQSVRWYLREKVRNLSRACYYLDSLGGVGEADDVDTVVCDSGLQDLRTVPESEQVPAGHAGDFWH